MFAYNQSARHIWNLIQEGESIAAIETDLISRFGIAPDVARSDIIAIVEHWHSQELLTDSGQENLCRLAPSFQDTIDWNHPGKQGWAATAIFTIRGKAFSLAVEAERSVAILSIFFRHLETPGARADVSLEIRESAEGRRALFVDGSERLCTQDEGLLIGAINQTILEHVHPGVEWLAMIHGGAVARNAKAVAISAASGSGKTTLIAHLLAHDGFEYLADDLIALSASTGRVVPFPMPISVKEGSWNLLSGHYPELLCAPVYRTQRGESARLLLPPSSAWDIDPVPVRALIFPRFVAGASVELKKIPPFDAIVRLLGDRIWLGYPMTEQRVRGFLEWLDATPAYTLVHGDVIEAARCVKQII